MLNEQTPQGDTEIRQKENGKMSTYKRDVQRNLDHMGTKATDWETTTVDEMPKHLLPAPTLFPATSMGGDFTSCELCGHKIKNLFHIFHAGRGFYLIIGSECVRQFGTGKSGAEISKEKQWEINREWLLNALCYYEKEFERRTAYRNHYGKADYNGQETFRDLGCALRPMLQKQRNGLEIKNVSITMFHSNAGKYVNTLIQMVKNNVNK